MIFPKGKVKHENLMMSYTHFPALLSSLKAEGFSGTIEIEFSGNRGIVFIDSGEMINGELEMAGGSKPMIGPEAIRYFQNLSARKDGILNIYQLSPEHVAIVASNLDHDTLYKGLSTDFTRLDRLILKLKEEKHNGFIEIFTKENQPKGVLFLQEGDLIEMFAVSESGPSLFGRKSISTFVEGAVKEGAIFNVYRSREKTLPEEEPMAHEEEVVELEVSALTGGKAGDMKDLVSILQEVLSRVEKLVDGVSKAGTFVGFFRKSLVEKAGEYPFLDPFSGEFEYREGTIVFTGKAEEKKFFEGIGECLHLALNRLQQELPRKKMLPLKLKTEIEAALEPHQETMKRMGVNSALSSFMK